MDEPIRMMSCDRLQRLRRNARLTDRGGAFAGAFFAVHSGEIFILLRGMDVYEQEGVPQNFAFYVHGRGHSVAHESRQLMYGGMDAHLKPAEATQTHLVTETDNQPAATTTEGASP